MWLTTLQPKGSCRADVLRHLWMLCLTARQRPALPVIGLDDQYVAPGVPEEHGGAYQHTGEAYDVRGVVGIGLRICFRHTRSLRGRGPGPEQSGGRSWAVGHLYG